VPFDFGQQASPSVSAATKRQATKAYQSGLVARAFRPEVAAARWRAYQRYKNQQKNLPRTVATPGPKPHTVIQVPTRQAPTEDVFRSPRLGPPQKNEPFRVPSFQDLLKAKLLATYVHSNVAPALETSGLSKIPGIDLAASIGGSTPFSAATLGASTGVGWLFDALNRFGAPAAAQFEAFSGRKPHSGPGGALGLIEPYLAGVKATKQVIPAGLPGSEKNYKTLSQVLPQHPTGNKFLDPAIRFGEDVLSNPLTFMPAMPIKSLGTVAADAVRARAAERFLGSRPYVAGNKFVDIGQAGTHIGPEGNLVRRPARGSGVYPRTQVPGLAPFNFPQEVANPLGRLTEKQRFLRNVQQSPYPAGLVGRGRGGVGPRLTERAAGPTLPGAIPPYAPNARAAELAKALTDREAFARRPAQGSVNRLSQRLQPLEETFSAVAGRGVRTPTLYGARRLGQRIAKKQVQVRSAAKVVAKKRSGETTLPKIPDYVTRVERTNVPGLVGRQVVSQSERQRKVFGLRKPEATPGGATYGVTQAGTRPRLRESAVPSIRTKYRGQDVETIGRYQVVPVGKFQYRLRDMKQRKWYGEPGGASTIRARAIALRRAGEERLPPVPEGHVRLYRGQNVAHEPMYKEGNKFIYPASGPGSEFKGRWFTADKKMAEHYGQEGESYYVDVPKGKLHEINQHPDKGAEVILPKEWAAKAVRYRRGPTAGAQRAQELAPKKGLPKRVKPPDVPYSKHNLAKLKADREAARTEFRTNMSHAIESSDLPKDLLRKVSRLRARTVIVEHMMMQLRRKILKLQGPAATSYVYRTSKERIALQRELEGYQNELDRTYNKIARILTKSEKGRRSGLIESYDKLLAATQAEKAAIADVSASIVGGRRSLKAALAARQGTRLGFTSEGKRELLRPTPADRRPLSQPPPAPDPVKVVARISQVLNTPYSIQSTKRVANLQHDLVALEDQWVERVGSAMRMSPTTAMRQGAKVERLRLKLAQLQNQMFADYKTFNPGKIDRTPTFEQKKILQSYFRVSEQKKMVRAILRTETDATNAAFHAGTGVHVGFPGFGVSLRVPGAIQKHVLDELAKLPGMASTIDFVRASKQIARDMLVTRYGPNAAVGQAQRVLDSFFQVSNGHNFNELRQLTIDALGRGAKNRTRRALGKLEAPNMTKDDLGKLSHWAETGEFDAELSPEAKAFAGKLQALVDRATNEYIQAGGDLERLGQSYVFHMIRHRQWNDVEKLSIDPKSLVYGNNPKFAIARPDPSATLRSLKNQGFDVEENIVLLTYMRLLAHNRAMGDLAMGHEVSAFFGSKLYRPGYIKVDTESLNVNAVSEAIHGAEKWMGVHQEDPVRSIFKLDKGLWFPEDVVKTLLKMQYIRQENAKYAYKIGRRVNSWWKNWALFTTGYDIRNQFGDMILGAQAGLQPFRAVIRGIPMLKASDKVARTGPQVAVDIARKVTGQKAIARTGPTYRQLRHEAEALGVSQRSVLTQETEAHLGGRVTGSSQPVNTGPWARFKLRGRSIRQGRENVNRLGAYGQQVVSKRTNPYLASKKVNQAYFDYGDVGSAVQRARTSPFGVPFITWLAKNIPAQIKRAPSRTNVELLNLNKQLAQESSSPDLGTPSFANQADYLAQRLAMPVPGINRFVYTGLPQIDLGRVLPTSATGGVGGPLSMNTWRTAGRQWAGDLAPLTQIATSVLTNTNPLTGDPVRDRVPASTADQIVRNIFNQPPEFVRRTDSSGKPVGIPATSGFQKLLTDTAFPPFGNVSRLGGYDAPGRSRVKLGPISIDPWQAASTFLGVSSRPIADKSLTRSALIGAEFDRRDALQKLTTHLKDYASSPTQKVSRPVIDAHGFITSFSPQGLKPEVIAYNRLLMKELEVKRIYDALMARG